MPAPTSGETLLKGARVIDPAQGIDRVADVLVAGGKIAAIGDVDAPGARVHDLAGSIVSPGWIDAHVHAYGSIGFSDLDSIGVCHGVTAMIDAGDAGIETLDEFVALIRGRNATDIYAGPHIHPLGIMGFDNYSGRGIKDVNVERWQAWEAKNPGFLRYLKVSAYSLPTSAPLYLAKGIAEELGIPLYQHIGEFTPEPATPSMLEYVFRIADKGDIITHLYHNNPGRLIDDDGRVLPIVRDAQRRGVLFDVSFGGLNFSWDVAEKCFAQDFLPDIISSDLQQYNVVYPCLSLSNIMSMFLHLGMPLADVIDRVTRRPATALGLAGKGGTLAVGHPADITVFNVEDGEFDYDDCYKHRRKGRQRIVPTLTFKNGEPVAADFERGKRESNWFMQIAEDAVPAAAERLSDAQRQFLRTLHDGLEAMSWRGYAGETGHMGALLDVEEVYRLHRMAHSALASSGIPLHDGLRAVLSCFYEHPFTVQVGLLLARLDRRFVLDRLRAVAMVPEHVGG